MNLLSLYLLLALWLFCIGVYLCISQKNAIRFLFGIELILNAANLNIVALSSEHHLNEGVGFVIFLIVLAACETAVALAILIKFYRAFRSVDLEVFKQD